MQLDKFINKHWKKEYVFSYEIEYKDSIWTSIRNNLSNKRKNNTDLEFSIIKGEGEMVKIKGSVAAISSHGGGITPMKNGFYEIRFCDLKQKVDGEWVPYLNEEINIDLRELFSEPTRIWDGHRKLCTFAVLHIGWDDNIKPQQRFRCEILDFARTLVTRIGR